MSTEAPWQPRPPQPPAAPTPPPAPPPPRPPEPPFVVQPYAPWASEEFLGHTPRPAVGCVAPAKPTDPERVYEGCVYKEAVRRELHEQAASTPEGRVYLEVEYLLQLGALREDDGEGGVWLESSHHGIVRSSTPYLGCPEPHWVDWEWAREALLEIWRVPAGVQPGQVGYYPVWEPMVRPTRLRVAQVAAEHALVCYAEQWGC
jgi:hypothetical protein